MDKPKINYVVVDREEEEKVRRDRELIQKMTPEERGNLPLSRICNASCYHKNILREGNSLRAQYCNWTAVAGAKSSFILEHIFSNAPCHIRFLMVKKFDSLCVKLCGLKNQLNEQPNDREAYDKLLVLTKIAHKTIEEFGRRFENAESNVLKAAQNVVDEWGENNLVDINSPVDVILKEALKNLNDPEMVPDFPDGVI